MAGSPVWKVYDELGTYIASVKSPAYGAMILAGTGGGTLRFGHNRVVWREGVDGQACESYDKVNAVAHERMMTRKDKR